MQASTRGGRAMRGLSLASLFVTLSFLIWPTGSALASTDSPPSCGTYNIDFISEQWYTSDDFVAGFRAPIQLRTDGVACTPDGTVSAWIGIESLTNYGISQIGWIHDAALGGAFCRFYEYNNGQGYDTGPVTSECNSVSNDTFHLFEVRDTYYTGLKGYYYTMYDCGTSDWSTCTNIDVGPHVGNLGNVNAAVPEEVHYECTNKLMGSSSDKDNFGNSSYSITGQHDYGGSFSVRSLSYIGPSNCATYYKAGTISDSQFSVYDTRDTH